VYYFTVAPELNDMITVSLIDDDELVDVKKENEDYDHMNVVECNENNEEEPSIGNFSKQLLNMFFYVIQF